jgi:hypothetical protein
MKQEQGKQTTYEITKALFHTPSPPIEIAFSHKIEENGLEGPLKLSEGLGHALRPPFFMVTDSSRNKEGTTELNPSGPLLI